MCISFILKIKKRKTPTQHTPPPHSTAVRINFETSLNPTVKIRGTALRTQMKLHSFTLITFRQSNFLMFRKQLNLGWEKAAQAQALTSTNFKATANSHRPTLTPLLTARKDWILDFAIFISDRRFVIRSVGNLGDWKGPEGKLGRGGGGMVGGIWDNKDFRWAYSQTREHIKTKQRLMNSWFKDC